ncbi:hypothetical protein KAR91_18635 [Candidatus Pacearchaeota archaeon]|nr:hypothetical protein [Candidatus Pacearchaeota archaeon]
MDFIELLKSGGYLAENVDEDALKTKVDEAVGTEVTEQVKEQTKGLIKNRDTIKDEKVKLKEQFDEYKTQMEFVDKNGISIEVFNDMKNELENYRAKGDSDEELAEKLKANYERGKTQAQDELAPKMTKLETDLENKTKEADTSRKKYYEYMADSEIRKAVSETGIQASDIWYTGLRQRAQIEILESGKLDISLPYENSGHLPLADWVKTYPASEEGKRMLPAKIDLGGKGFGGSGGGNDDGKTNVETLNDMFKF